MNEHLSSFDDRRRFERLDRAAISAHQLERLNRLLNELHSQNEFYHRKFRHSPRQLTCLHELSALPFTHKEELQTAGGHGPPANLTYPLDQYVRYHQTSGTHGRPMAVFDTADDWNWWIDAWQYVLDAAGLTARDRAFLAFSFGPFVGFWSAFDALTARGVLAIPGGGMSSEARLELIKRTEATVLFCTPTYALRLVEVAAEQGIDVAKLPVRAIVVAGEPGGSLPAVRDRIESAWDAVVYDHAGATEVGPWGCPGSDRRGIHVTESHFIAEFISVDTQQPAREGELAHLVLTTLGRAGAPVVRYRTGDLVRHSWRIAGDNRFVFLEGGVLGRADDMAIIRGVNVFPSSLAEILHGFPEIAEFRITACKKGEMDDLLVEVEDHLNEPSRIAAEIQLRLGLQVTVRVVPPVSLPRFEGKGRRFADLRNAGAPSRGAPRTAV